MPCDGMHGDGYTDVLNAILAVINSQDVDFIVCGGDFNTDMSRIHSFNSRTLQSFLLNEKFTLVDSLPPFHVGYTFESFIDGSRSAIDHFLVSGLDRLESILEVNVLDDPDNMSDHLVLSMSVALDSVLVSTARHLPTTLPTVLVWIDLDGIAHQMRISDGTK